MTQVYLQILTVPWCHSRENQELGRKSTTLAASSCHLPPRVAPIWTQDPMTLLARPPELVLSGGSEDHLPTGDDSSLPRGELWCCIDTASWNRQKHMRYSNKTKVIWWHFLASNFTTVQKKHWRVLESYSTYSVCRLLLQPSSISIMYLNCRTKTCMNCSSLRPGIRDCCSAPYVIFYWRTREQCNARSHPLGLWQFRSHVLEADGEQIDVPQWMKTCNKKKLNITKDLFSRV